MVLRRAWDHLVDERESIRREISDFKMIIEDERKKIVEESESFRNERNDLQLENAKVQAQLGVLISSTGDNGFCADSLAFSDEKTKFLPTYMLFITLFDLLKVFIVALLACYMQ